MQPLGRLAALVGGTLHGDSTLTCTGAQPPLEASSGDITMVDDIERRDLLDATSAQAIVLPKKVDDCRSAQLIVDDPHRAFASIVAVFRPPLTERNFDVGIDPTARVAPSARIHPTATVAADVIIGERVQILPGAVLMPRCSIGDDCVIGCGAVLYEYTCLADRVILHAGTVLGANGFGYRLVDGRHVPTAQLGYVEVGADVEVGACVTIDRGTYGATRIGEGTKIDNQVMIAHNCNIGRHNLICSQVGIAGSCRTGDYVILAGQVGLKDHISLGDRAVVGAQAGVMDDCPGGDVYLGSPATSQREQMQIMAVQRRLPEMRRELKQLRRELDSLRDALPINRRDAA